MTTYKLGYLIVSLNRESEYLALYKLNTWVDNSLNIKLLLCYIFN